MGRTLWGEERDVLVEKMRINKPELWDEQVWNLSSIEEDKYVEKRIKSIVWKRIKEKVLQEFGSFKGLKIIEIGAGIGTVSLLFAMEGADVTVLDYSKKAIDSSKLLFKRKKQVANFIQMDALNLDKKLISQFDVSMSFGAAEHFKDEKRIIFIKSHLDVLKEGGVTFICVPNKWNFPYRLWMFLSQSFGRWKFGEEYPFSRAEFRKIGNMFGVKFNIIGSYLFGNNFLIKKRLRNFVGLTESTKINNEFGTPLDKYFSPSIIAVVKK